MNMKTHSVSAVLTHYSESVSVGMLINRTSYVLDSASASWMGPIYNFLGLTVGVIVSNMDNERRRQAYSCDVTYGTNNEFGFDYLRDNMKLRYQDKIQPLHHYCIIDEIDSILIDEARTPLIISGPADDDTEFARNAEKITSYFKECEKDPGLL